VEPLIGTFLNMVALRCDGSGDPTFIDLLRRSREMALNAFSHSDLPFEALMRRVKIERDSSRNPIFQVMLQVLSNAAPSIGDLDVSIFHFDLKFAQFDLSLHLYEEAGGYWGRFEYCSDLFHADTIQRLCAHFGNLLQAIAREPDKKISALPMLSDADRQQLLDRRALPAPSVGPPRGVPVAPRTRTEEMVFGVFCSVLQRTDFGVFDSFFELGGDSLKAARLMLQLRSESGHDLPLRVLFERATVSALAEAIDAIAWLASADHQPAVAENREEIEL